MIMEKNEVICISSDDDAESEKTNDKEDKFLCFNKKIDQLKCVNSSAKVPNDNEKKDNQQKRKISEVDGTSTIKDNAIDKKIKITPSQEVNGNSTKESGKINEENGVESQEQTSISTTSETIKPQLVIKEKKTISPPEQDVFPMFISLCLQKKREPEMETIVGKLKRWYELMNPVYAKSETFQNFLNRKRDAILSNNHRTYYHIMEVITEMKAKARGTSKGTSQVEKNKNNVHKDIPSSSKTSLSTFNNTDEAEVDEEDNEEDAMDPGVRKKLKKIIKTMDACESRIKALEAAEVDFNDEDNSNYMKLERYKERMVKLYNEYCRITGDNADAGRSYLRPKHLNITHISCMDQAITNFINAKITEGKKLKKSGRFTDALIFPDYRDILKCVSDCNNKNKLGLETKKLSQYAKKAFIDLGEHLQRARRNDYWDTFSLFLENKKDDPALRDSELAQKLHINREVGEKKLKEVFQEYVQKQEAMKDLLPEDKADTENDDDEDEDENSEEDDEDDDEDDEDENDNVEGEDEVDEDEEAVDNSGKNKNGNTNSINNVSSNTVDVENCMLENEDVVLTNDQEARCDKKHSKDKSVRSENAVEELDLTTESDVSVIRQSSTVNNDDTENEIQDEAVENVLMDKDCDVRTYKSKPLLRVRSFAKPPTTWEDNKQKSLNAKHDTAREVIDLTNEIPKAKVERPKVKLQVGKRRGLPSKSKRKTVIIPANWTRKSIISVKNITINSRDILASTSSDFTTNEIVKSLPVVKQVVDSSSVNTIISLPHFSEQNTNSTENTSGNNQKQTIVHLLIPTNQVHPNKSIEVPVTTTSENRPK